MTFQKNTFLAYSFLLCAVHDYFVFSPLKFVSIMQLNVSRQSQLNKYRERICCYFLAVLTTPKKVFARSNFRDNVTIYVEVLSSMHSNVQYCIYYCSLPSSLLKVYYFYLPLVRIFALAIVRQLLITDYLADLCIFSWSRADSLVDWCILSCKFDKSMHPELIIWHIFYLRFLQDLTMGESIF